MPRRPNPESVVGRADTWTHSLFALFFMYPILTFCPRRVHMVTWAVGAARPLSCRRVRRSRSRSSATTARRTLKGPSGLWPKVGEAADLCRRGGRERWTEESHSPAKGGLICRVRVFAVLLVGLTTPVGAGHSAAPSVVNIDAESLEKLLDNGVRVMSADLRPAAQRRLRRLRDGQGR
jgi:hypothetical protein